MAYQAWQGYGFKAIVVDQNDPGCRQIRERERARKLHWSHRRDEANLHFAHLLLRCTLENLHVRKPKMLNQDFGLHLWVVRHD